MTGEILFLNPRYELLLDYSFIIGLFRFIMLGCIGAEPSEYGSDIRLYDVTSFVLQNDLFVYKSLQVIF